MDYFILKKDIFQEEHGATKNKSPYTAVKVWFDDYGVWVHWPEKEPQSVIWNKLIGIAVETTYSCDVIH